MLERINLERDLHFQTQTTIDTLDYSGTDINCGSKVILSVCGESQRQLKNDKPKLNLPGEFTSLSIPLPGVIAIDSPKFTSHEDAKNEIESLSRALENQLDANSYPLIILTEDSEFCTKHINNFLWVTFTRSNPSHDIYGVGEFTQFKHWGCKGSLIIDARIKPHHAPPLIEDPEVSKRVDQLFKEIPELAAYS